MLYLVSYKVDFTHNRLFLFQAKLAKCLLIGLVSAGLICFGGQVLIAWGNYDLCKRFSTDDSGSLLYRIVKRIHLLVHILRCMVGMCVSRQFTWRIYDSI